jgi:hypothetical protein
MLENVKTLHVSPSEINDADTCYIALARAQGEHFFCLDWFIEDDLFEGNYPKLRQYYDTILPSIRTDLEELLMRCKPLVRVYLGCEVSTLYAAYYAIVNGARLAVTIVNPQFMGGKTPWAVNHPLVLNRLITTVISNAFEVEIRGKDHFEKLPKAFPKIEREYILSDLPEVDTEDARPLSYPLNNGNMGQ